MMPTLKNKYVSFKNSLSRLHFGLIMMLGWIGLKNGKQNANCKGNIAFMALLEKMNRFLSFGGIRLQAYQKISYKINTYTCSTFSCEHVLFTF
jgi:hypothetical protein